MIVGFTGTHKGMTALQKQTVRELFELLPLHVLHHGDCIGADATAHSYAVVLHAMTIVHPPIDKRRRAWCRGDVTLLPLPFLKRNQKIVEAAHVLIATPATVQEVLRSGTWATIRYARKLCRHTIIVQPNGQRVVYNEPPATLEL